MRKVSRQRGSPRTKGNFDHYPLPSVQPSERCDFKCKQTPKNCLCIIPFVLWLVFARCALSAANSVIVRGLSQGKFTTMHLHYSISLFNGTARKLYGIRYQVAKYSTRYTLDIIQAQNIQKEIQEKIFQYGIQDQEQDIH